MTATKRKPHISNADFKARIAAIMRGSNRSADEESLIYHPPKVLPPIYRKPTDYGYYPPPRRRPITE